MNNRQFRALVTETVRSTIQSIILEGIFDDLKKSNPEFVDQISNLENSGELPIGYAKWAAKQLKMGFDAAKILATAKEFDKIKSRLKNKDLYAYTIPDIEEVVQSMSAKKSPKSKKVFEDDKWIIIQLLNKEAAQKYGKSTKWCISGVCDNKFDEYSEEGEDFYVVINKATQERYAIQHNVGGGDDDGDIYFWDAADNQIAHSKLAEIFIDESFQDILMDLLGNEDLFF